MFFYNLGYEFDNLLLFYFFVSYLNCEGNLGGFYCCVKDFCNLIEVYFDGFLL